MAICLLLFHHLFYQQAGTGLTVLGYPLLQSLAHLASVCIAMFVILSGYGLEAGIRRPIGLKQFYLRRLASLYVNYWFIWLVFVPPGLAFFGRTLSNVFGSHVASGLVLNILGLQRFFHTPTYNPTWWFVSLIVGLYFIFPMLHTLLRVFGFRFVVVCASSLLVARLEFTLPWGTMYWSFFCPWVFPFVLGAYLAQVNGLYRLKHLLSHGPVTKGLLYTGVGIILILQRHLGPFLSGIRVDGLFGLWMIMVTYEYLGRAAPVEKAFAFLGKHAFNIFLFHTLLYQYYVPQLVYSFGNPIIVFAAFLAACAGVSVALNMLGTFVGVWRLREYLRNWRVEDRVLLARPSCHPTSYDAVGAREYEERTRPMPAVSRTERLN